MENWNLWEDGKLIATFDSPQKVFDFAVERYKREVDGEYILRLKKEKRDSFWAGWLTSGLAVLVFSLLIKLFNSL